MNVKKRCVSCKEEISSHPHSVQFKCPNCDETIIRCGKCRKLMLKWTCPSCGFTGP